MKRERPRRPGIGSHGDAVMGSVGGTENTEDRDRRQQVQRWEEGLGNPSPGPPLSLCSLAMMFLTLSGDSSFQLLDSLS